MEKYLYIFEKPSARQNGIKALGGSSGVFEGEEFATVNLIGHILQGYTPEEQAYDVYKDRVGGFSNVQGIPWSPEYFDFRKRQPSKAMGDTPGKILKSISEYLKAGYIPVIATDLDPSCEGDAVGHEVLDYLGYTGVRYREFHVGESIKEFQKAFREKQEVTADDRRYKKAYTRSDADYMSQQLTRVATIEMQKQGYKIPGPVPFGRLQSRFLVVLGQQLHKIKVYKPSSVFESRYKLDNLILSNKDVKQFQTEAEWNPEDLPLEAKVREIKQVPGVTIPPKPFTFDDVLGAMTKKGMSLAVAEKMYQAMYEADGDGQQNGYLTYPRTEDDHITFEQFNEITPLLDKILTVIGLPTAAFTHRQPRSTHVKNEGAHGANRPGLAIPKSLEDLDARFGKGAGEMYKLVASRFVMMYLEDTEWIRHDYETIGTSVPFTGSVKIITKQGVVDPDEDKSDVATSLPDLNKMAKLYAHEVKSKKPQQPTSNWLLAQLKSENVGTPATRPQTLIRMIGDIKKPIKSGKVLSLNPLGQLGYKAGELCEIGSVDGTKFIQDLVEDVYKGTITPIDAVTQFNEMLKRDIDVLRNTHFDLSEFGFEKQSPKEYAKGVWLGNEVEFNRVYGGHRFTDNEVETLLNDGEVTIHVKGKDGSDLIMKGKLEEQEFKGRTFIGFHGSIVRTDLVEGIWQGREIKFKDSYAGHKFTSSEIDSLLNDEEIEIEGKSKDGSPIKMRGKLEEQEYKGRTFIGFHGSIIRDDLVEGVWQGRAIHFKNTYAGHKFTDSEITSLLNGDEIEIEGKSKNGSPIKLVGKLAEQEYQGRKFIGFSGDIVREGYVDGVWQGREVSIKGLFAGHKFTDIELTALFAGQVIEFTGKTKSGDPMDFKGKLEEFQFNGRDIVGFKPVFEMKDREGYVRGVWRGKEVQFKSSFMGYNFTDDDIKSLLAGDKIVFTGVSKGGKQMVVGGGLAVQDYQGRKFVGFKAEFDNKTGEGDGVL